MSYIDIEDVRFSGFLHIFNLVLENGDIYFPASNKNESTLKNLCAIFESSGYGIFSFAHAMPFLYEKLDFEFFSERGDNFVVFKLAPFLGLPGNDFNAELCELKDFLIWIKDKAFSYPEQELRLILDAVADHATFNLCGFDKELMLSLNQEMYNKIDSSPVLKQWLDNQKKGIINRKEELNLFDLFANFPASYLMNKEQLDEYSKLMSQKINKKAIKKNII